VSPRAQLVYFDMKYPRKIPGYNNMSQNALRTLKKLAAY